VTQTVRVGAFEPLTQAMGPGRRACLWVAGCSLNCKGCATPEFIPRESGTERPVADVIAEIFAAADQHGLEGVSFSGGEPFQQAEALAVIAAAVRERGLSTVSWSGYVRRHLEGASAPAGAAALLSRLDVLIDGRFVERRMGGGPLRGSSNQRIHLLTERYAEGDFTDRVIEAHADAASGKLVVNGVDDMRGLRVFLQMFGA
jgi:anaerobic ribonucleoside-triphosphate reductase activating protein